MKKLILACIISGAFISCSSEKELKSDAAPAGMHALDLSSYGKPFSIFVPDTNSARLEITEQSSGALEIKAGPGFAVSISETAADIALKKEDIRSDEVNRFKSFVTEEPDGIIWESAIVDPEFHFLLNAKVDGREYSFEDVRDAEKKPFGRAAVETMYSSCKQLQPAKKSDT